MFYKTITFIPKFSVFIWASQVTLHPWESSGGGGSRGRGGKDGRGGRCPLPRGQLPPQENEKIKIK